MKIRKNDKVMIMKGKDKGKIGLVVRTFPKKNTVLIEGLNVYKKHRKGEVKGKGEMANLSMPIDASKVMYVDPTTNKPTRVGYKIEGNIKQRISKKTGELIINKVVEVTNETKEPTKSKKVSTKKTSEKGKKKSTKSK